MANEQNPIDEIFRSGLKDSGITPPAGVWESVSAGLSSTVSKGVFSAIFKSVWTWVAVAGLGITTVVLITPAENAVINGQPAETADVQPPIKNQTAEIATQVPSEKSAIKPELQSPKVSKSDNKRENESAVTRVISGSQPESHGVATKEDNHAAEKSTEKAAPRLAIENNSLVNTSPCGRSLKVSAVGNTLDNSWTFSLPNAPAGAYCAWSFGDGETGSGNPANHVYPDQNAEYTVKVMVFRSANCMDSGVYKFMVRQRHPGLSVPDVFTPNGDGINDELVITLPEVTQFNQIVTDRYGKQVFVSNDPMKRWNGKCASIDCAPGTYKVFITYKSPTAKTAVAFSKSILLNR
jgi:gliding motility-associated-like protein